MESMTGYAQSSKDFNIIIKSVNHKHFEINFKLPDILPTPEQHLRSLVAKNIPRGRIDIQIRIQSPDTYTLNMEIVNKYIELINNDKLKQFNGQMSSLDFLKLPNVLSIKKTASLIPQFEATLKALIKDRQKEGNIIKNDIKTHIKLIENNFSNIRKSIPNKAAIENDYLTKLGKANLHMPEGKIAEEVAHITIKLDITEEINRFKKHLALFKKNLDSTQRELGKRLEFILIEMLREINTISAKINDFNIQKSAIDIKCEIEKIKEQINNVQ